MEEQNNEPKEECRDCDDCESCESCSSCDCSDCGDFGNCDHRYTLKLKIDGNEFEFSSPDKETFETTGLKILKKTFGRYEDL